MRAAASAGWRAALGRELGAEVVGAVPVSGGDIHSAWSVSLSTGERLFVKTPPGGSSSAASGRFPGTYASEVQGLRWLRAPGALALPEVIAWRDGPQAYLAMELVELGQGSEACAETLGRGLAALHGAAPAGFGLDHDNLIGRLPQDNRPASDWASFYRDRRLQPQIRLAGEQLPVDLRRELDHLLERLPEVVGPAEPPARCHGDLWGGNWLVDSRGEPVLIDPAVCGAHRELDLAMMRLFGGFPDRVFEAYAESRPLAPGAVDRVPLYQLYFLLVHVNLFGAGYLGSVRAALRACPT